MNAQRHTIANGLRIAGGAGCTLLLLWVAPRITSPGHALLYLASWVTFLHLSIGVFIFVRHLHAYQKAQQVLDLIAAACLIGGLLSFARPTLWCSFFAALVAVAVLKYTLLYPTQTNPVLKKYVRAKILLEGPAAILLALAAAIFAFGDLPVWVRLGIQAVILAGTTTFAVWMIFIRRSYHPFLPSAPTSTTLE
ncbi:MAG: hypothetical protein ACNA71_07355 [Kiritimatiellia bacterium]